MLFSCSVMANFLWPRGLQHARLLRPSLSPACPLSRWWHPTISSSFIPFSSCLQSVPESGFFSNELALRIRWPKYWSFSISISPSNEWSGLISFRIDWFDLLAVQGTLKESSPAPQFGGINSLALGLLYGPTLTAIHDYWKNHSFDYTQTFVGPENLHV